MTFGIAGAFQELKTPPTSYFIKKALDLTSGSQKPGHQAAGQLSLKHVLEIATVTIGRSLSPDPCGFRPYQAGRTSW